MNLIHYVNMKNVRSSQASISVNSFTEWIEYTVFCVSIVNKQAARIQKQAVLSFNLSFW